MNIVNICSKTNKHRSRRYMNHIAEAKIHELADEILQKIPASEMPRFKSELAVVSEKLHTSVFEHAKDKIGGKPMSEGFTEFVKNGASITRRIITRLQTRLSVPLTKWEYDLPVR